MIYTISEKMESKTGKAKPGKKAPGWQKLEKIMSSKLGQSGSNKSTIKTELEGMDIDEILVAEDSIKKIGPELIKASKLSSLAIYEGGQENTVAKILKSMKFKAKTGINCYCTPKEEEIGLEPTSLPECSILKGGLADREFYISLSHHTMIDSNIRTTNLMLRFDPKVDKKMMLYPMLAIWDLFRVLIKAEGIDIERAAPFIPRNTYSAHINIFAIRTDKEDRGKIAEVCNTLLTTWPRAIRIILGYIGIYMPTELHVVMPGDKYSRYWHAGTVLYDHDQEGIHKYQVYQGIFTEHRKISTAQFKTYADIAPAASPGFSDKATFLVDLIRNGRNTIQDRVASLATNGIKLVSNVLSFSRSKYNKDISGRHCAAGALRGNCYRRQGEQGSRGRNLHPADHAESDPMGRPNGNLYIRHCSKEQVLKHTCISHILFFRQIMEVSLNAELFLPADNILKNRYPRSSPLLHTEIIIAQGAMRRFLEWNDARTVEDIRREENEVANRYNKEGSDMPIPPPFSFCMPFIQREAEQGQSKRDSPRTDIRWMPRSIKLEWGNLPTERQISHVIALLPTLNNLQIKENRAGIRVFKQGNNSHRTKEIQFEEPGKLIQFTHMGQVILVSNSQYLKPRI